MITFKQFNELYNGDNASYLQLLDGKPISENVILTFDEIVSIANRIPDMEIGWIVPKGYLIIDIDDKDTSDILLKIIKDRNEKVMCVRTHKGMHIYCKSDYDLKTTNNIVACGAQVNTICHNKNLSYLTTPFKNPRVNKSYKLSDRDIVYYNDIDKIPFWLKPIYKRGKKQDDTLITFPIKEAKIDTYNRQLWKLKSSELSPRERGECIRIINTYVALNPLNEEIIDSIIQRDSNNENIPAQDFFNKSEFLHDKMGDFLIDYLKIKKDYRTHNLFYYDDSKGLYVQNNDYIKGIMTKMCPQLKEYQKKEALNYIDNILELNLTTFNNDPMYITFLNGRLDLRTLEFEELSSSHLETIHLNVNWNPKSTGKTADDFFNTATCGDEDCKRLLYEAIGYSFIKTSALQKAFLLYGGGRNGKSTFLDIINKICGPENCTSVSFKDLGEKFRVAELYNKLVSLSGDISAQPLKDSDLFKQIIGGDEITIERKNKDPFTSSVFATLFFSANKLPRTPDTTFGFYRKLVIIPFNANLSNVSTVEGAQFHDRLMKEVEYITYNAVMAIRNVLLNTHKFTEPQSAIEVMEKYKTDNSSMLSWIKGRKLSKYDLKKDTIINLHCDYYAYCNECGYKPLALSRFKQEIIDEFGLKENDENKFIDK